jgi:RNA polymerase sigma-70 factor (ECF subfamily)
MHDDELIDRLVRGDSAAFEQLLATYQDRIVSTCYRFVHHAADAEDVAQEVFIEILQSIGAFRRDARLATWIYRVAVTRSLDFCRQKKRKKRLGHLKQVLGWPKDEGNRALDPEDRSEPAERLEHEERAAILARAVAALPESQRIAITLNQYEGLRYAEVADIMGTSLSAVESLLFRAKKNLRRQLRRYYEEKSL